MIGHVQLLYVPFAPENLQVPAGPNEMGSLVNQAPTWGQTTLNFQRGKPAPAARINMLTGSRNATGSTGSTGSEPAVQLTPHRVEGLLTSYAKLAMVNVICHQPKKT